MKLTKHSKITIVIPRNGTPREIFAAGELEKYLKLIFAGISVAVCENTEAKGDKILIGGPERNAQTAKWISEKEFDEAVPGPEGMMLRAFGEDTLLVAGSSKNTNENERGTVYAVYEFLERLGCSFGAYIKEGVAGGEYVPQLTQADLAGLCYVKARADVPQRLAVVQYNYQHNSENSFQYALDIPFIDWLCKNRYNTMETWCSVYASLKNSGVVAEYQKRGFILGAGMHDTFDLILPRYGNEYFPEHYFETHPEYYRLEADGTRFAGKGHFFGQLSLCARNEEMIDRFAENLNHFFDVNASVKVFALEMNDGIDDMCHCQMCRKYTKMENFVHFFRGVARRVAKRHPDIKLSLPVYTDLWKPPEGLDSLEPNIIALEATWAADGLRKTGKPDGSCLNGTEFETNILRWKKLGIDVVYYDYFMGVYGGRQRFTPMADEIQAIASRVVEKGIYGMYTQIEIFNLWNNVFNFFCFGRSSYNTDISMEDNLARFSRIFGEGGKYVAEIIRCAENLLDGQPTIDEAGRWLQEHIDKAWVYETYEKALAAAETPAARNNVKMMRMVFRYSDLETRQPEIKEYQDIRTYTIPERGELIYMQKNFDTYQTNAGFGVAFPVTGEDNGFTPDKWYEFESC